MAGKCSRTCCPLQYKEGETLTDECNAAETCPYRTDDPNDIIYEFVCVGLLMTVTGASLDECSTAYKEVIARLKGESING